MKFEDFKEVLAEYGVPFSEWGGIKYHGINLGYYHEHLIKENTLSLIAHFVIGEKIAIATNKDELRDMLGVAVKIAKDLEVRDKLTTMKKDFDD